MSFIYQETSPLSTRQVHVTSTVGMAECLILTSCSVCEFKCSL